MLIYTCSLSQIWLDYFWFLDPNLPWILWLFWILHDETVSDICLKSYIWNIHYKIFFSQWTVYILKYDTEEGWHDSVSSAMSVESDVP